MYLCSRKNRLNTPGVLTGQLRGHCKVMGLAPWTSSPLEAEERKANQRTKSLLNSLNNAFIVSTITKITISKST